MATREGQIYQQQGPQEQQQQQQQQHRHPPHVHSTPQQQVYMSTANVSHFQTPVPFPFQHQRFTPHQQIAPDTRDTTTMTRLPSTSEIAPYNSSYMDVSSAYGYQSQGSQEQSKHAFVLPTYTQDESQKDQQQRPNTSPYMPMVHPPPPMGPPSQMPMQPTMMPINPSQMPNFAATHYTASGSKRSFSQAQAPQPMAQLYTQPPQMPYKPQMGAPQYQPQPMMSQYQPQQLPQDAVPPTYYQAPPLPHPATASPVAQGYTLEQGKRTSMLSASSQRSMSTPSHSFAHEGSSTSSAHLGAPFDPHAYTAYPTSNFTMNYSTSSTVGYPSSSYPSSLNTDVAHSYPSFPTLAPPTEDKTETESPSTSPKTKKARSESELNDLKKEDSGRSSPRNSKPSRRIRCYVCGKMISRDISRHMRIHEEVSRFQCLFPREFCSHKTGFFNRQYDFKKHLLHYHFKFDDVNVKKFNSLNEKLPFVGTCGCGASMTANDWLATHICMTDQTGGYKCPDLQGKWDSHRSQRMIYSSTMAYNSSEQAQGAGLQRLPSHNYQAQPPPPQH